MAGPLALPAGFGADAAMLMMVRVLLALIGAQAAEVGAGFQHLHRESRRRSGPPRQDRTRGGAGIGAVKVEANAARQARYTGLGQTGIGAGHAGLGALGTGLYATDESVTDDAGRFGMAGQHLAHGHAGLLLGYGNNARLRTLVTGG